MTRFCRACQTSKPVDQFQSNGCCRSCVAQGEGPQGVRVRLPAGWSSRHPGIPDMAVPSRAELEAGYGGDLWSAGKLTWRLDVLWRGDIGKYRCRAVKDDEDDNPREARTFDYPHEVVEWLGGWFTRLMKV